MKENIAHVIVTLDVGGKPALFVLLSEDGSINRMGTGSPSNSDHDLYIGAGQAALFADFMRRVPEEIFPYRGRYEIPGRSGAECTLAIRFATRNDETVSFEFLYGTESEGPPQEIRDVAMAAVEVTDCWYEKQQAIVHGGGEAKPKRSWRDLFRWMR
jgi:hypothetical protein